MKAIVRVDGKKYVVPQELTVSQFEQLYTWGVDDTRARKMVCAVVLNAPLNQFNNISDEELETLFAICLTPLTSLETAGQCDFDFNQLTFGQFIDLDVMSHEGLFKVASQAIEIVHPEVQSEEPITKYWPMLRDWVHWRDSLYKEYSGFFNVGESVEGAEEGESNDIRRTWYMAVVALAGEDFMKINQVVERPTREALNFLAYLKDQAFKRSQEQKRRLAATKHR